MKLTEISLSDCIIRNITKENKCIQIEMEQIFEIESKKAIKNAVISIKDWDIFTAKIFISSKPFAKLIEKELTEAEYEEFKMIHEIEVNDNILILRGFSKNSGYWLEWKFVNSTFEVS